MRTSDRRLAKALRDVGMEALAQRAGAGEFNDFFSQHGMPKAELLRELGAEREKTRNEEFAASLIVLIERVTAGEFDSGKEEGDEWMASEDGQAIARELLS